MKKRLIILAAVLWAGVNCFAEEAVAVTHSEFQAVNADGTSAFAGNGPFQVVLEGILLNNPEQWLDPTPDPTPGPWQMGGEWEIVVQGEGSDHAGTFCWMGQNYGNGPGTDNYTNEEWLSEITRLNRDPNSGYIFRAGDRVRVTGAYLFYGGKLNINENHQTVDMFDFKVELVTPAAGLPQPEEISLSDIKNPDNTDMFDPNRISGGEYYQSRLVRVRDVRVADPENWAPEAQITIRDSSGLSLPVRLGRGYGFSRFDCPEGEIDVIGIVDQSAPGYPPNCTKGYRLLVLNYDGNGLVLGDTNNTRGNMPADINRDYSVDIADFAELAGAWLDYTPGL